MRTPLALARLGAAEREQPAPQQLRRGPHLLDAVAQRLQQRGLPVGAALRTALGLAEIDLEIARPSPQPRRLRPRLLALLLALLALLALLLALLALLLALLALLLALLLLLALRLLFLLALLLFLLALTLALLFVLAARAALPTVANPSLPHPACGPCSAPESQALRV